MRHFMRWSELAPVLNEEEQKQKPSRFILLLLTLLFLLIFVPPVLADDDDDDDDDKKNKPVITRTLVDLDIGEIVIQGEALHTGVFPTVILGRNGKKGIPVDEVLPVSSIDAEGKQITAELPSGILGGTHLLTVKTKKGKAEFHADVGAQGPGSDAFFKSDFYTASGNSTPCTDVDGDCSAFALCADTNDIPIQLDCLGTSAAEFKIHKWETTIGSDLERARGTCFARNRAPSGSEPLNAQLICLAVPGGVVPPNQPPVTGVVTASPLEAFTNTSLSCSVSGSSDPEGDPITHDFRWFINGSVVTGETTNQLDSTNYVKGDEVVCEATANDGTNTGDPKNSDPVVIKDSPPRILTTSIEPQSPLPGDPITCSFTAFDRDGDQPQARFVLFVNFLDVDSFDTAPGILSHTFDTTSLFLQEGDEIFCEITVIGEAVPVPEQTDIVTVQPLP